MTSTTPRGCGGDGRRPSTRAGEVGHRARVATLDTSERAEWQAIAAGEDWDEFGQPISDLDLLASLASEGAPAVHPLHLPGLAGIDVTALADPLDRVAYLRALDRVAALVAALQTEALVAVAGPESSAAYLDEVHVEHEVAVARRCSRYAAGKAIDVARTLTSTFPGFLAALRAGEVSAGHCAVLVERTSAVTDDEALARIAELALPKARRLAVGEFGRAVVALIALCDPDTTARHERARESRRVTARQLDDGLGYLGLVHDWSVVSAIHDAVTTDAHAIRSAATSTGSQSSASDTEADNADSRTTTADLDPDAAWEDPGLDALRADAFAARMLGTIGSDGSIQWDRSTANVEVQLVIDLDTLRREQDNPCLLDGQPVPADVGRSLAAHATAWRRMVTDPVTGHLLDYGRTQYLPEPLRRYVLARDGQCRAPGCTTRSPRRLQMDHAEEFPTGGSDAANTGALCSTCHQLKTARHVDITDSAADGSAEWRTSWGQRVRIPPRRYLPGSEPDPPPGELASPTPARPAGSSAPDIAPF